MREKLVMMLPIMFLESQLTRRTQVHYFCEDYLNNNLEKVEEQKKG